MSFSCPFDSASTTTPCEQDLVVNILRDLLGDNYVNAFLMNNKSPALADLVEPTILSMTLSLLASVAITAAILIFVISIYKWVTESANDGEAVGLSERGGILGMFGRPFFALALLVPTASGYPTINLIIMTVVLWANGATNQLYEQVSNKTVNVLNIDGTFLESEAFRQANDVTDAYVSGAAQGYCIAQLLNSGSNIMANNKVVRFIDDNPSMPITVPTTKTTYSDKSGWFLSKSRDVCGSFDTSALTEQGIIGNPSNKITNSDIYPSILAIQKAQAKPIVDLVELRRGYAALAYMQGMNEALGSQNLNKIFGLAPLSTPNTSVLSSKILGTGSSALASSTLPPSEGWDIDLTLDQVKNPANIKELMDRAKATSDSLHSNAKRLMRQQVVENGGYVGTLERAGEEIKRLLLSSGWMNAGNAQATLRQLKTGSTDKVNYRAYNTNFSLGYTAEELEEDDNKTNVLNSTQAIVTAINQGVAENLPKGHPAQITLASQLLQADMEKGNDGGSTANNMAATLAAPYHGMNETLISIIVDENSTDDTLTRIQNFGEWLLMIIGASLASIILIKIAIMVSKTAAATASGMTFGIAKGAEAAVTNGGNLIDDILLSPLGELLDTFLLLSRIFGVVIPSMPYIFLILAGIGWFIQIIQTMFGMPLWLIMHSIPDKSFIGSQQQGYVTLLSMLFRPILIISGFYVAFDLYDPLIIYATKAFFDSYGTISGASSSNTVSEFLIYFGSLKYWYFLYAGVLMSITFLVFGLVQELSDSVLDWLGTNLLRGFGNMDSKSTMQGITSAMAVSSNKGRAAIANRMKARNDAAAMRGDQGNNPKNPKEQAAADAAVARVRASEGGGNATTGSSANSADAVVPNTERDITQASESPNSVSVDDAGGSSSDPNRGTLDQLSSRFDSNKDVTNSGSEVSSPVISSDADFNNAAPEVDDIDGSVNAKGSETNDASVSGTSSSSKSTPDGAGVAGGSIKGVSGSADSVSNGSSGGASGSSVSLGTPSTASNNKLAAIAGASGLLAGKALGSRAGGLTGQAAAGKGTVTATDGGSFTTTGLGANGDITATGQVTESGYTAHLTQTRDGQEFSIGSESVQASADGNSVTATIVNPDGSSMVTTTDADNNMLTQTEQRPLEGGGLQTETRDNVAGTTELTVDNADKSSFQQISDNATGAVLQTQTSNADSSVVSTVDFTPTTGSNSVATGSTLVDNVSGVTRTNTFDPQAQTARSTTVNSDGVTQTTTIPNAVIDSAGEVAPIAPITPFINSTKPPSGGTGGGGGGGTPPSGGGDYTPATPSSSTTGGTSSTAFTGQQSSVTSTTTPDVSYQASSSPAAQGQFTGDGGSVSTTATSQGAPSEPYANSATGGNPTAGLAAAAAGLAATQSARQATSASAQGGDSVSATATPQGAPSAPYANNATGGNPAAGLAAAQSARQAAPASAQGGSVSTTATPQGAPSAPYANRATGGNPAAGLAAAQSARQAAPASAQGGSVSTTATPQGAPSAPNVSYANSATGGNPAAGLAAAQSARQAAPASAQGGSVSTTATPQGAPSAPYANSATGGNPAAGLAAAQSARQAAPASAQGGSVSTTATPQGAPSAPNVSYANTSTSRSSVARPATRVSNVVPITQGVSARAAATTRVNRSAQTQPLSSRSINSAAPTPRVANGGYSSSGYQSPTSQPISSANSAVTAASPLRQTTFTPTGSNVSALSRRTTGVPVKQKLGSTPRNTPKPNVQPIGSKPVKQVNTTSNVMTSQQPPPAAVIPSAADVVDSGSRVLNRRNQLEGFEDIDEDSSITSTNSGNKKPSSPKPE